MPQAVFSIYRNVLYTMYFIMHDTVAIKRKNDLEKCVDI